MTKNNAGKQHHTAMIWCEGIDPVHLLYLRKFLNNKEIKYNPRNILLKELIDRVIF